MFLATTNYICCLEIKYRQFRPELEVQCYLMSKR